MIDRQFQVNYEIGKIKFHTMSFPIKDGPGTGKLKVTEISIQTFESPKLSFNFAPPNGIAWNSSGGSTKIFGRWNARYKLIIPVSSLRKVHCILVCTYCVCGLMMITIMMIDVANHHDVIDLNCWQ
ncbi:unnamed protein product [Gongylonema pulchrum]|uniref:Arrestin_N domain-containing protein n=1 Tax=Gongylonema pulchrum TaxID=637853 RepID=A0A183ELY3_9BILA|nr:unnamed protein product [Gongylonema pulchrum]